MAGTKVTVVGVDNAIRHLDIFASNMVVFGEAFQDIGEKFREQASIQFNSRGAFAGVRGPWKPLSPVTIALRGGGNRPLVRYGSLMSSYVNSGDPQNISQIGLRDARFGSSYRGISNKGKIVPLAKWHQTGTRNMPARPVVLGNRILDEQILDAFEDQLFSGWF